MRLTALLKLRCPHCLQGPIYATLFRMEERCPVCGIVYEREHGYFMMAIFFGYVLGFLATLPVIGLLYLLQAPVYGYAIGILAALIVTSPWLFRYSRAIWMHLDELMDPRPKDGGQA